MNFILIISPHFDNSGVVCGGGNVVFRRFVIPGCSKRSLASVVLHDNFN
jgi:hypothetical protein